MYCSCIATLLLGNRVGVRCVQLIKSVGTLSAKSVNKIIGVLLRCSYLWQVLPCLHTASESLSESPLGFAPAHSINIVHTLNLIYAISIYKNSLQVYGFVLVLTCSVNCETQVCARCKCNYFNLTLPSSSSQGGQVKQTGHTLRQTF